MSETIKVDDQSRGPVPSTRSVTGDADFGQNRTSAILLGLEVVEHLKLTLSVPRH